jgi:hypothetical protein
MRMTLLMLRCELYYSSMPDIRRWFSGKKESHRESHVAFGARLMLVFKLAAILESGGYAPLKRRLPLGGGYIQQPGLVFAAAYTIAELIGLPNSAAT